MGQMPGGERGGNVGRAEDENAQRDDGRRKMPPFRLLFILTGLYFWEEKRPIWRHLRLLLAYFFIPITFLHLGFFLSSLIKYGKHPVLTSVILLSNTHSAIIQIHFCYWQFRGHFPRLLEIISSTKLSKGRIRTIFWQTLCICLAMFVIINATEGLNFYFKQIGILRYEDGRNALIREIGWLKGILFMLLDSWHSDFVNLVIMALFNVLIRILIDELDQLNDRLIHQQGPLNEFELADICSQFLGIIKRVRRIDAVFQVFLFLIIATNIPMTVSTLLRIFNRFKDWCWLQFSVLLGDLLGCLFELIGLTAMASVLHTKLAEVPANLIEQYKVHEVLLKNPHNHICCLLTRMSGGGQSDIGISLWGFTIISKPVILTVLSLVLTYLTIVIQFMRK